MAEKLLLGVVNGMLRIGSIGEASEAVSYFPAREDLPFGGGKAVT
jgi:hypothetical protein